MASNIEEMRHTGGRSVTWYDMRESVSDCYVTEVGDVVVAVLENVCCRHASQMRGCLGRAVSGNNQEFSP